MVCVFLQVLGVLGLAIGTRANIWESWTKVDRSAIYTPADFGYNHAWYSVEKRTWTTFSIKACSDAHVIIASVKGQTGKLTTEIVIGGWHNSKSVIRSNNKHVAIATETGVLHCHEFRTFWLSWVNGTVSFGKGPERDEQVLLRWSPGVYFHNVTALSVSSGYSHTAVWRFAQNQATEMEMKTPKTYRHEYLWRTVEKEKFVRFSVRSCHDAMIALSAIEGAEKFQTYEVIIGGWKNKKAVIKSDITNENFPAENNLPDLLSCNEARPFWISWFGNTTGIGTRLRAGRGYVINQDVLLDWVDPKPHPIRALSFSTGYGANGTWLFKEDYEDQYVFSTSASDTAYSVYVTVPESYTIVFDVKACADARLVLASDIGVYNDAATHVVLGTEGNTRSKIHEGNMKEIVNINTPNILSCNLYRTFWVHWHSSRTKISVGKGRVVGQGTFMIAERQSFPKVTNIAFGTASQSGALFDIKENVGTTVCLNTSTTSNYGETWLTTESKQYITFRVKACQSAQIAIAGIVGEAEKQTWEIIIGGWDNSKSVIKWPDTEGGNLVENETIGILSCDEHRSFWLGWVNGKVAVGKGYKYGMNKFLEYPQIKPHPVKAVTMLTQFAKGSWLFNEDTGDTITIYTPAVREHDVRWLRTPLHKLNVFYFKVKACEDVHLVLAEKTYNTETGIEIVIGNNNNARTQLLNLSANAMEIASKQTPGILHCEILRSFWIGWGMINRKSIEFGTGLIYGKGTILSASLQQPNDVQAISYTSGSSAEWRFDQNEITYLSYATPNVYSTESLWFTAKHIADIKFSVQSCNTVYIYLTSIPEIVTEMSYEIMLSNGKSRISQGHNGRVFVEVDTPGLLDCELYKWFWIKWLNGDISVGSGRAIVGSDRIMGWSDLNPHPVGAIGMSSSERNLAQWLISIDPVEVPIPPSTPGGPSQEKGQGYTPGQVAGTVIGFLVLFVLTVVAVFIILRPPDRLAGILGPKAPPPQPGFDNPIAETNSRDEQPSAPPSQGFDNPVVRMPDH